MPNPTTSSKAQTTERAAQKPELSSILQCHLTPSALHALSVLYPKVFRAN